MPLNKLDNFIKNTEGRILYVSPADLDATDSIDNTGNSLARPFKTIQRALIESARFSYVKGKNNDEVEKTTILLMPGEHEIDNRPGYTIFDSGGAKVTSADGVINSQSAGAYLPLTLESVFDVTQPNNDLYKFNSVYGGVIVPRGTSIVGLDLRKTKIRPKYIPNPTDDSVDNSAIFRITGACYFWQFSIFDGDEFGTVYTQNNDFGIQSSPTFSHHKLTCFEYADGVNNVSGYSHTDLEMYYAKLSVAYGTGSGRNVDSNDVFPTSEEGFTSQRPEYEIVGAFASDPLTITNIKAGDGGVTVTRVITVTTQQPHGLNAGTPIRISGVSDILYNISTKVVEVVNDTQFTYTITADPSSINPNINNSGIVTVETDTVSGASPYIFNISMRSIWGMNGMHADGSKATGFRSMVVAQFTGVSLQKDDRAFVQYKPSSRTYENAFYSAGTTQSGAVLSANSSSSGVVYHLESDAIYRKGWEQTHIKITNDAILQIVSVFAIGFNKHFSCESGGDASVTNSNSNFGQLSLNSDGFKKESFEKDDKAFLTHIIPPRTIESAEENIDWLTIDQDASNTTTQLYLFGFNNFDIKPPILTQGFRVGAKVGDKLYLGNNSADIVMQNGASSFEEYSVGSPVSNTFTTTGTHNLTTGEKVIIISDDGDLPENLKTNTVYYAIAPNNTTIKLAASESEAISDEPLVVYGGTNLKILTRVSDKQSGDFGHPVQWDSGVGQWYITVSSTGNTITSQLTGSGATEATYIKRISDNRSLDEKIYKLRVVVPSSLQNAKTPESGFVIQESSSTGLREGDAALTTIQRSDYDYNRNPRFISTCSRSSNTVTVVSELPHNLQIGDSVIIRNVTDDSVVQDAYNGTYTVTTISNDLTFQYETTLTPGTFTNDTSVRDTNLPRFERNNFQSNLYIYRNEIISEYSDGVKNGVYHLYQLNSNNAVQDEFTNLKYSQSVTNLYPQLDRDNIDDNPLATKSYALRSPLGEVETNDYKKSITRESVDLLFETLGIGRKITSVSSSPTSATITFERDHGFGSIVTYSSLTPGSTYNDGTYYNVKLLNGSQTGTWRGATAKVTVTGGAITEAEIINGGSYYNAAGLYFDQSVIGAGDGAARFTITNNTISSQVGDVVQFTGIGTGTDTYHRITSIDATNQVSVAKTSGDTTITSDYYAFVTAPSTAFTGVGNTITATAHGLTVGNKFRSIDLSNNNLGDYIVDTVVGVNTFTVSGGIGAASGYILKHGLSSNQGVSDKTNENLQARAITIFNNETLTLTETGGISISDTSFAVSNSGIGTIQRFPLGSYIQIDDEIMRVASDSLGGLSGDEITVIRGVLATKANTHSENSLIKKIKVPSIEFRRPSIIRASGHTFEYLGYGPGNYSTALPQVQDRTLSEREEFLSQAQERSSGIVVYTGMNNKGDFFIGNQKKSSATGEETTFDTPIPTVTGEDPSRLSAVFDEVIIKERLVVEGGDSGQVLSQFDGPVTFNGEIKSTDKVRITNETDSTSPTSGALTISGGVGIGSDLNIGGDVDVDGTLISTGADIGNVQIGITDDQTVDTVSGNLVLDSATNTVEINATTNISEDLNVGSGITFTASTGRIAVQYLDAPNVSPIGGIIAWPGGVNTWPTQNWRQCNGAELDRTTYADLFAIIGTTYGSGDGSTTFNLPNLSSRFIGGIGDSPLDSLGNTGGNNNAVLVAHNHGITDPGHQHGYTDNVSNLSGSRYGDEGERLLINNQNVGRNTTFSETKITINTKGLNTSGNNNTSQTGTNANLPPYMALYWIIRIQ